MSRQRGGMWVLIAKEVRRNVGKAVDAIKGERKNSGSSLVKRKRKRGREYRKSGSPRDT